MESVRRSKRAKIPVDYAQFDNETDLGDCRRIEYGRLAGAVLRWPESTGGTNCLTTLSPDQLSAHVHRTGFQSPCVVRALPHSPQALGIRLPVREITVQRLADFIDPHQPIITIDVETQSEGPIYTMKEWVDYFLSTNPKKPLLNVVSLDLSNTPLQGMIDAPSLVKELDLVGKAWPHSHHPIPKVQLYALMSVANCFTDFHIDFGGSSVWYHVLSGKKIFLIVPPTKGNLIMFEEWASSDKQANTFFGERVNDCQKVELYAGDTFFLPGGWPHSVVTPVDSLVIGGNFLTGYNLSLQLEVWNMEERLKVRAKYRFPLYKHLMWHTASYYLKLLSRSVNGEPGLSQWENEGVVMLWRSLNSWLQRSRDCGEIPKEVSDAAMLLEDLRRCILNLGLLTEDSAKRNILKASLLRRESFAICEERHATSNGKTQKWVKKESNGSAR